jgi:hypothetical protein
MPNNIIEWLGEINPQLRRELKGRLNYRHISIAIGISGLVQGAIWFLFNSQKGSVQYCNNLDVAISDLMGIQPCSLMDEKYNINWLWSNLFGCLSWILALTLILGSVYLLIADSIEERKQGTLDCIRLSPQSPQTIFSGKILGVPSLLYLAIGVALPLHTWMGIQAGGSLQLIAAWDATIGAMWWLGASMAVCYGLLGGKQAILVTLGMAYPVVTIVSTLNTYLVGTLYRSTWLDNPHTMSWFGLPVRSSAVWFYAFGSGCCLMASYWVWQAIERRYLDPTASVLSKYQSYLANLNFQLWLLGLALPLGHFARIEPSYPGSGEEVKIRSHYFYYLGDTLTAIAIASAIAICCLIPLLLPSKKALQEWSSQRHKLVTGSGRKLWQGDVMLDLIRGERSPAMLAIAINIGIAIGFCLTVVVVFLVADWRQGKPISALLWFRPIVTIFFAGSAILLYATIAHLSLLLKFKRRNLGIVAVLGGVMLWFGLPHVAPVGIAAVLLLFTPLPLAFEGLCNLAVETILATLGAQLALVWALNYLFDRRLRGSPQSRHRRLIASGHH